MKKYIPILLIPILLVLTAACSSITEKRNDNEKSDKPITTTQADLTTNGNNRLTNKESTNMNAYDSSTSEAALEPFIGEWKTTKRLIIPSDYSEEELKERDMVGHNVIIKPDLFTDASTQYNKPYYKISNISDNEFVGENIGTFANSSLGKLNIRNKSTITKLDVYFDKSLEFLIETFYLEDENTLVTNSNFIAFFELKRIE